MEKHIALLSKGAIINKMEKEASQCMTPSCVEVFAG